MNYKRSISVRGFTLVELLIVVAIIAILAAIATMNYQHASTKSKVARVHSDMRAISSSLEAYRADHQAYPAAAVGDIQLAEPLLALTYPTAYMTAVPEDPFGTVPLDLNPDLLMAGYNYKDRKTTSVGMSADTYGDVWKSLPDKDYMLHSSGPNCIWDVTPYVDYDPTNGTASKGDISRFGPY